MPKRSTCCICGKKRDVYYMIRISWYYSPFPGRITLLTTNVCNSTRKIYEKRSCQEKFEDLKKINPNEYYSAGDPEILVSTGRTFPSAS